MIPILTSLLETGKVYYEIGNIILMAHRVINNSVLRDFRVSGSYLDWEVGLLLLCMPIVMMRRMMYYWHVLHTDENKLLRRFISAHQIWTGRTDWISQVEKNMTDIYAK